jgi:hypothetical protein
VAQNGQGVGVTYAPSEDGKTPGGIAFTEDELSAMLNEELAMSRTAQTTEGETVASGEPGVQLSPEQREQFVTMLDRVARYNKGDPVTLVRPLLGVMFGDGTISADQGRVILNEDTDPLEVFMDGATFAQLYNMNRAVVEGRQKSQAGDVSRMYASTAPTPDGGRRPLIEDRASRAGPDLVQGYEDMRDQISGALSPTRGRSAGQGPTSHPTTPRRNPSVRISSVSSGTDIPAASWSSTLATGRSAAARSRRRTSRPTTGSTPCGRTCPAT